MAKTIAGLLAIAVNLSWPCHADSPDRYTAKLMLSYCEEKEGGRLDRACVGYLYGAWHSLGTMLGGREMRYWLGICEPSDVTIAQLREQFVVYGNSHPEGLGEPPHDVFVWMMQEAFPCD